MFSILLALIALAAIIPFGPCSLAAAEDDERAAAFNNHCRNCHSFKAGDNRLGPSLHGVFGSPAGRVEGYRGYSGSLAGLIWDEANLDKFIASPAAVATNTTMIYPAVAEAAERAKIIEFLKTISRPEATSLGSPPSR